MSDPYKAGQHPPHQCVGAFLGDFLVLLSGLSGRDLTGPSRH
jgi:hypothetical protein